MNDYGVNVQTTTFIDASNIMSNGGVIKSSDFGQLKNSKFKGDVTLRKIGGIDNSCHGGNTFSPQVKIINFSSHLWRVSADAPNVVIDL